MSRNNNDARGGFGRGRGGRGRGRGLFFGNRNNANRGEREAVHSRRFRPQNVKRCNHVDLGRIIPI